jgi:hypothetical protein
MRFANKYVVKMIAEKIGVCFAFGGKRLNRKLEIEHFLYRRIARLQPNKIVTKPHLMLIHKSGTMVNGIDHLLLLVIMGKIGF